MSKRKSSSALKDKPYADWQSLQDTHGLKPHEKPRHRANLPKEELTEKEQERKSWGALARVLCPIADWLPKYGYDCAMYTGCASEGVKTPVRDGLRRDIVAGMVIGIMLVPQGMAYGLLAGLPPVYGLYGSIWPQLAYAIFGTCKFLGPGVNAPISLLMVDSLNFLPSINGTDCTDRTPDGELTADCLLFIEYSMLLGLVVSVLYIIMAVLRLGVVTAFMPEPALAGFTSGAAIVIVTSQLKHFIGMPSVPRGGVPATIGYILTHFHTVPNIATTLMGVFSLIVLISLKCVNAMPKVKAKLPIPIPEQLVVLIFAILISAAGNLHENFQVPIVGAVPGKFYKCFLYNNFFNVSSFSCFFSTISTFLFTSLCLLFFPIFSLFLTVSQCYIFPCLICVFNMFVCFCFCFCFFFLVLNSRSKSTTTTRSNHGEIISHNWTKYHRSSNYIHFDS